MAKKAKAILCDIEGNIVVRNMVVPFRYVKDDIVTHGGQDYRIMAIKRPDLADITLPAADKQDPQCRYIVKPV